MWKTAAAAILALAAGAAAAVCVAERWRKAVDSSVPEWTRLPNGLRFRVQRVKDAKDVAVVTVFGIGSDMDPPGKIGLAHLAEHLYVTAAAGAEPARTADEWAELYGEKCSATTHETFTCMAGVVGPKRLERELAGVAARMSALRIESTDLDRERPRVLEQIAELGEPVAPWSPAIRLARARMHPVPNAGHAGGLAEDLNRMSLDDVRSFARRAYCPANARIAVAGDVDPADVATQVERLFAALPAGEPTPEPPRVEPQFGDVRIDRGASPGPGYEACRGVCFAYACDFGEPANHAAAHAFGFWRVDGATRPDGFIVLPRDDWIEVLWKGDERPIEEVTAEFDTLVENFARHATGVAAADQIREARKAMRKAFAEFKKVGLPLSDEEPSPSLTAASRLAVPGARLNEWDSLLAAVERLTNEDMRRFVESWHVAERRVVVDVRGWRPPPEPDPDATTTEPTPSRAPSAALVVEVRVTVTWDEATQSVHRTIAGREYAKDDDLQKAVAEAHKALANDGKADAPVTIDADPRIPWNEVITVVNIIKRCGIDKIEFAMGAPPKRKTPK